MVPAKLSQPQAFPLAASEAALREGGTFKNYFVHGGSQRSDILLPEVKKKISADLECSRHFRR